MKLPTLEEVQAAWRKRGFQKGQSRLEAKVEAEVDEGKLEREWKRGLWLRDKGCCRLCGRRVKRTMELDPERGECHHVSGRHPLVIRWDRRNGLLVCLACHQRITGKVSEKCILVATRMFKVRTLRGWVEYPDATHRVTLKRIA